MELVGIEVSKVIYLTQMTRSKGQPYQPDAIQKLAARYSFLKIPTIEDLLKPERHFQIGKFNESQIQDLGIYNDGCIISAASDTDILDAFLDDMIQFSRSELGVVETIVAAKEKTYESSLVVKAETDLLRAVAPRKEFAAAFNKVFKPDRYLASPMQPISFVLDSETHVGIRKPMRFGIDRRLGSRFEENVFYSQAPLRTQDHLEVLREIERLAIDA